MNERKLLAALLGFGFAAAWIGFNFGYALLCLAAAAGFYLGAAYLEGELDLDEVRDRMGPPQRRSGATRPPGPPPVPRTRRSARVR